MSCCLGRGLTSEERDAGVRNALSNTILVVFLGIITGSNVMFSVTQIVAQIYSFAVQREITSGAVGLWSGVISLLTALPTILMVITKSPSWFYIQNYSLIYLILSNWTGIIVGIVENVLDTNFDVNKWVNSVLIAMNAMITSTNLIITIVFYGFVFREFRKLRKAKTTVSAEEALDEAQEGKEDESKVDNETSGSKVSKTVENVKKKVINSSNKVRDTVNKIPANLTEDPSRKTELEELVKSTINQTSGSVVQSNTKSVVRQVNVANIAGGIRVTLDIDEK